MRGARRRGLRLTLTHLFKVGDLLVQMLKHPLTRTKQEPRINIDEALQHQAWGPLLTDEPRVKRGRPDNYREV